MHLKRLEMVGFKSFAEPTVLDFEPGIVCVVGPNGCGKSNVVDAVRWCLGEMSAKSLRSKHLVDVIFNGSSTRAGSQLAEVSLTFDNSEKRLPVDYGEVTITRRLFRSGESEYLLNKTQCRLRDIHDLFLDTGIGEEGYSIMEQGRVEYILNARPEDRRELFEEAAGVSRYKARREEALRKIERTQTDLDRLSDVITLTHEQMGKIESAVKKARQYQKLQEDLKALEVSQNLWDLSRTGTELEALRQEITDLDDQLQAKVTQTDQWEAKATEWQRQEVEVGEKIFELGRQMADLDGAIALSEQKTQHAQERELEIRHRDEVLEAEIAHGTTRLGELGEAVTQSRAALEDEEKMWRELDTQTQTAESHWKTRSDAQRFLEDKLKTLQDRLWENTQEQSRLHNEIVHQRSTETRLDTERRERQKALSQTEEKRAQLQAAHAAEAIEREHQQTSLERAQTAMAHAQRAESVLKERAEQLTAVMTEARQALFRVQAQIQAADESLANDPYVQGAQAVRAQHLPGVFGPLGELVSVSSADEPVVRRVLGTHLNDLVADTLDNAEGALRFLAASGKGRARIFVLDRLPQAPVPAGFGVGEAQNVFHMVKADVQFEPVLNLLLSSWQASGQALYGAGVMEGGADAIPNTGADSLRRQQLKEDEAGRRAALAEAEAQLANLTEEAAQARQSLEELRHAAQTLSVQVQFLTREGEKHSVSQAGIDQDIARLTDELKRLDDDQQKAAAAAQTLSLRIEEMRSAEQGLRVEWQGLQAESLTLQSDVSEATGKLEVLRDRLKNQDERLRWRRSQWEAADGELNSLTASLAAKQQEKATSQERVQEQLHIQQDSRRQVLELTAKRQALEGRFEELQRTRHDFSTQMAEAQTALSTLRLEADELREKAQERKIKQSHAEFKTEAATQFLRDKYSLSLEEARSTFLTPNEAVPAEELERLRRRVESLGAVNLAAPEEYTQLTERHTFLVGQQQDLLKAKEDLLQTIQKINATTRESFKETFQKVQENFRQIYGQLFQGGQADLRFTDESDLLNTGVEIYAQPPGKKLQNIALLSGGERALTAVALLFAFFMVRPSPFAILDEVDAPLDEANVARFITLIRAFTHQSQFLLITHNKRTMEMANTLYGVTMETLGVSRVLSVKMRVEGQAVSTRAPESVIQDAAQPGEPVSV